MDFQAADGSWQQTIHWWSEGSLQANSRGSVGGRQVVGDGQARGGLTGKWRKIGSSQRVIWAQKAGNMLADSGPSQQMNGGKEQGVSGQ